MRSLLVQASSVEKAVEKAWADAGQPTEFVIKVHDFGKKGFLGITKKPAIISIQYEPQKQTSIGRAPKTQQRQTRPQRQKQPRRPVGSKPVRPKPVGSRPQTKQPPAQKPAGASPQPERQYWSDLLIDDITTWLTEITKTIGIDSPFNAKSDKKTLTITFTREVLQSRDEERLLFSGLSYLLIQFLKKKHKKKYQGYKLMLTSR